MVANVYFELTRAFNARGPAVTLASGQAVVFYRLAIMSKDGDWVIREEPAACRHVLDVLTARGAWYRPGAPLDVRWLAGGWSSHFEFRDERGRRVRCDFFSRPPRVAPAAIARLFGAPADPFIVVDRESLIRMKQTQRDKDHAIIAELARGLPAEREVRYTTDPDRLLALAPAHGAAVPRPAVQAALAGDRDSVVVELARERDRQRRADRARLDAYAAAAQPYLEAFGTLDADARRLPVAHETVCGLAEQLLPARIDVTEDRDAEPE